MYEDLIERKLVESGSVPRSAAPVRAGGAGGTTARPLAKLAVGILAGVSAVLLPRVLALTAQSDATQLVFFPKPYFLLAAGLGLLVGLVMLVFEYQVPTKPRDTFMAALGIPAIISGALGTASGADSVSRLEREAAELRQAIGHDQGIVKSGEFLRIEPLVVPAAPKPGEPLVQAQADDPVRFGIRVEQPQYVIVLKEAASAEQAMRDEQQLRRQLPAARGVKADRGYFVVLGASPTNETEALLAASRAKKLAGDAVQPVLVEVKR